MRSDHSLVYQNKSSYRMVKCLKFRLIIPGIYALLIFSWICSLNDNFLSNHTSNSLTLSLLTSANAHFWQFQALVTNHKQTFAVTAFEFMSIMHAVLVITCTEVKNILGRTEITVDLYLYVCYLDTTLQTIRVFTEPENSVEPEVQAPTLTDK